MSVFVGVENNGWTKVFEARGYQVSSYITFMSNQFIKRIDFSYPGGIKFSLKKFDTSALKGDYSRFCVLVNERGEEHILSDDKNLLRGFTGWKNRLTDAGQYGGARKKKKSSKKRKTVKKSGSKRKRKSKKSKCKN